MGDLGLQADRLLKRLSIMDWIIDNIIICWWINGHLSLWKRKNYYGSYYNLSGWIFYKYFPNSDSKKDAKKAFIDSYHF